MPAPVLARLLIIGDEILSGATRDKNAGWLGERLDALGHVVDRVVFVPDQEEAIVEELARALDHADLVLTSGGLGPTHDDRTTSAVARYLGVGLAVDEAGWARITARYGRRAPPPTTETYEAAKRMVRIPEGATALENPVGAASAYCVAPRPGKLLIVLPGVPAELQGIFEGSIAGKLVPAAAPLAVAEIDLYVAEAAFAAALERIERETPGVAIGSYPHFGEARVTIRVKGPPEAVALARARLMRELGAHAERPSR